MPEAVHATSSCGKCKGERVITAIFIGGQAGTRPHQMAFPAALGALGRRFSTPAWFGAVALKRSAGVKFRTLAAFCLLKPICVLAVNKAQAFKHLDRPGIEWADVGV